MHMDTTVYLFTLRFIFSISDIRDVRELYTSTLYRCSLTYLIEKVGLPLAEQ